MEAVIVVLVSITYHLQVTDLVLVLIQDRKPHILPEAVVPVVLAEAAAGTSEEAAASAVEAVAAVLEGSGNTERIESRLVPGLYLLLRWNFTKTVL